MSLLAACVVLGVAVLSWAFTARVRSYALSRSVLDIPNERSAHVVPTPRGGGVAIVVATLLGLAILVLAGRVVVPVGVGIGGGGLLIAVIGWMDDHRSVPASRRALVHFLAASWSVWWLGGYPHLAFGTIGVNLGVAGFALAVIGIVWVTNFYNFMDGIDGIAGGEATSVGVWAAAILYSRNAPGLAAFALVVTSAAFGFLMWNWAPAKIFMGDVGSGFLGFVFASLAVASENAGVMPVLAWVILLGVFAFDATVTLLRRGRRKETLHAAHRNHAYQRAVRAGFTHREVSGAVILFNFALGILALVAVQKPAIAPAALALAIVSLTMAFRRIETLYPMREG